MKQKQVGESLARVLRDSGMRSHGANREHAVAEVSFHMLLVYLSGLLSLHYLLIVFRARAALNGKVLVVLRG